MGLDSFRSGDVEGQNESEDLGETERLFPNIRLIDDEDIVAGVKEYVEKEVPAYFWKAPASSNNDYHHEIATNHRGLWAHTLMATTALEIRKWTYKNMGFVSHHELDCARAALLLHDTKKYGDKYWDGKYADNDHDMQAANAVREIDGLPDTVAECIESHMGPANKYKGPDPRNHLEMFVHLSDMMASDPDNTVGIWKPPEELIEVNGSVVEANNLR